MNLCSTQQKANDKVGTEIMSAFDFRPSRKWSLAFLVVAAISTPKFAIAQEIDFERDVARIFEERCWYCHGGDEPESGLRLDRRPNMLRGGDSGLPAVVPGAPEKSYLIEVINHVDPDMAMPPDEDKIPSKEIELLTKWIREGAVWPGQMDAKYEQESDHWSFQPVERPEVPGLAEGAEQRGSEQRNPVDAFLQDKLQKNGLRFAEQADARTLIRRLSIVLTGLPPTPEQVERFLVAYQEDEESAYSNLVDELLDSPHFGERWAQHWLDVIRWAETNGSESNLYRKNAWVFRDYVVRSFNEDKPYDQFVREQIAGDTLGVGEATGFLVSGPHVPAATVGREPSAIRQARADRMDEIIQTVGASVMGVTMGCARCHNHKFDPVSIQDYYAMTAVFQDIEFGSRNPEYGTEHPIRMRGQEILDQINNLRTELSTYGGWEEHWGAYRELHFKPISTKALRIRFKVKNLFVDELEVFGPKQTGKNLALAASGTKLSGFPEKGFENRNPIERLTDGQYGTMIWRAQTKDGEEKPWVRFDFNAEQTIGHLRISNNREYYYETDYLEKKPSVPRYEFDIDFLTEDGKWQPWAGTWAINKKLPEKHADRKQPLKKLQSLIDQLIEEGPRSSFVGRFVEPEVTRVLLRGSPESPRDEVFPAGPEVFGGDLGLDSDASGPKRRGEFADWITSPDNPLTARVMANRIWHHVFGRGIVSTTSDFGKAGAEPTHPELLDWLAAEFAEPTFSPQIGSEKTKAAKLDSLKPWSVKSFIRLLVTSRAFRQSSRPTEEGMAKDAATTLLWRFPPKRVEAEVIRDATLLASGALDQTIGGRSYRIHNIKKTYAQWEVVDNFGPETWRRMLYQERMRRVDDQMFTAFDFPDCGQVRAKRPVSTTPLQALNLMNSEFVMKQAERIAKRAMQERGRDLNAAVARCFELLLGRSPDEEELSACVQLASDESLQIVCRVLINSNEFAFLP